MEYIGMFAFVTCNAYEGNKKFDSFYQITKLLQVGFFDKIGGLYEITDIKTNKTYEMWGDALHVWKRVDGIKNFQSELNKIKQENKQLMKFVIDTENKIKGYKSNGATPNQLLDFIYNDAHELINPNNKEVK